MTKYVYPKGAITEVNNWLAFLDKLAVKPEDAAPVHVAWFCLEHFPNKSVQLRAKYQTNLRSFHEQNWPKQKNPFKANPIADPLGVTFLDRTFDDVVQWLRSATNHAHRAAVAASLFLYCAAEQFAEVKIANNVAHVAGRCVPLTHEVVGWLQAVPSEDWTMPSAWSYQELKTIMTAELMRRNVPEVTRAALYGRWSAEKFFFSSGNLGLFRTPLQVPRD